MCQFYRLSNMVEKARDFGNEMAAKTAQQAAKFAAKAKEGWRNRGKKGVFAKALKWTRELAQDVIEEYKNEAGDGGDKSEVNGGNKNGDKNVKKDDKMIEANEITHITSLSEQDMISLDQLRENSSILLLPVHAVTTSGKASFVAMEKETIALLKAIGEERAVIVEMKNVKAITEMKLVKEEADTLAIAFGTEMWTLQLEEAAKLQNAISSALAESE